MLRNTRNVPKGISRLLFAYCLRIGKTFYRKSGDSFLKKHKRWKTFNMKIHVTTEVQTGGFILFYLTNSVQFSRKIKLSL